MPLTTAVVADVTDFLGPLIRSTTLPRFVERIEGRAGVRRERSATVVLTRLAERSDLLAGR